MRAAVLDDGLRIMSWPEPEAGPGEALIAPMKVGICGSDVHFVLDGTAQPRFRPIVLGHEAMGVVVAVAAGTDGPPPGSRVSLIPLVSCYNCDQCRRGRTILCRSSECLGAERNGAWAELISVPVRNLVPVPEGVSDELAAVATDSVATAYHAVARRGGVGPGSRVAVWGTGGLGLSAVGIAKTLGATAVIAVDPRPQAREWALATGADQAVPPGDALEAISDLGGVDTALEFVGRPDTLELAVRSLDAGGVAVAVGIGSGNVQARKLMTFVVRERAVVGSYGNEPEEVREVLDLLSSGRLVLPHVVGDVIPLANVNAGLARVAAGDTGGSRILLDIQNEAEAE